MLRQLNEASLGFAMFCRLLMFVSSYYAVFNVPRVGRLNDKNAGAEIMQLFSSLIPQPIDWVERPSKIIT